MTQTNRQNFFLNQLTELIYLNKSVWFNQPGFNCELYSKITQINWIHFRPRSFRNEQIDSLKHTVCEYN